MADQIYIGNFTRGQKTDRLPFNIDNDAFPTMFNFYSWRGRAKKKRGTSTLARLQRQVVSVAVVVNPWEKGPLALIAGVGNLKTGFSLEANSSITPGTINFSVTGNIYTEPVPPDGTLLKNLAIDPGSEINYSTGIVTIAGGGVGPLIGTFSYFPDLPVLGLEDFIPNDVNSNFPVLQAFDPTYSYQINQVATPFFYTTDFYKFTNKPFIWSNTDDNLFWSTNYQSAFWVTNNKPGLHFKAITAIAQVSATRVNVNIAGHGFTIPGDYLWFNEVTGTIAPAVPPANPNTNINGQTGIVTAVIDGSNLQVDFTGVNSSDLSNFAVGTVGAGGIAQYLTSSISGQDGIKWYDGDPTSGTGLPTGTNLGWVNFAPPLADFANGPVGLNDQTPAKYYLVGALAILPFKDRLLFFGPQIQAAGGAVLQKPLQDTVLWSWNGTPYYSALVPTNLTNSETSNPKAYYVNQSGFAGFLPAGISQPIMVINNNEDVILIGFGGSGKKTRFVYTGNDLQPFLFYLINSEIPSSSTFSGITLDKGGLEIGSYGITITTQQSCERIDLDIPDSVFQIQAANSGQKRVNAIRDYFREWIYFAYPVNNSPWKYPAQSFFLNYRDNTWAIFRENFTRHGTFRKQSKNTWKTIGIKFGSWGNWKEPWNAGSSSQLFPSIIAGNPQGFVLIKDQGTSEAPSGYISAISNDGLGFTQITSFNHCVNSQSSVQGTNGDYLLFLNSIGSTYLNNQIGLVTNTIDADNFVVDIPFTAGTYLGLGTYTRLTQPLLQTKQFPFYWEQGRKVRLGAQRYLMDFTESSQVTVNINLSQDPDDVWNEGPIVPSIDVTNSSLIYSQVLFTCPESTNIGLTQANSNLQMPTALGQFQIWHRMNTSLIGDSVQIGITLSDEQMRNFTFATSEITLHGIHLEVSPGPLLA